MCYVLSTAREKSIKTDTVQNVRQFNPLSEHFQGQEWNSSVLNPVG